MAVQSWHKKIRESGELAVIAGATFKGGQWITALDAAIKIFNKLMSDNGVTLTLTKAGEAKDALVVVEATSVKASFTFGGNDYSVTLDGNGLHGKTRAMAVQYGKKEPLIEKAFVFVPATPRVDSQNRKSREVGSEVRNFLLVHEFIHAAGLSNDEHTNDDVFCYPAEILAAKQPVDDRLQPWGGLGKPAPPYILIGKTVSNLKKAWP